MSNPVKIILISGSEEQEKWIRALFEEAGGRVHLSRLDCPGLDDLKRLVFCDTNLLVFDENVPHSTRVFILHFLQQMESVLRVLPAPAYPASKTAAESFESILLHTLAVLQKENTRREKYGARQVDTISFEALAGCVVHDLNNILSVLVPNVGMALTTSKEMVSVAEVREELEEIQLASNQLHRMALQLNRLMPHSRQAVTETTLGCLLDEAKLEIRNRDRPAGRLSWSCEERNLPVCRNVHELNELLLQAGEFADRNVAGECGFAEVVASVKESDLLIQAFAFSSIATKENVEWHPVELGPVLRNVGLMVAHCLTLREGGSWKACTGANHAMLLEMELPLSSLRWNSGAKSVSEQNNEKGGLNE